MAELNNNSSPNREGDGGGTTIEARFANFCKNDLPLGNDNFLVQATKLFDQSKNLLLANVSAIGTETISQLSLTFKEIIFNYRKQPQCKPQVFRSVYVDWKAPRRTGVFIPAMKPLLVELAPGGSEQGSSHIAEAKNNVDGACPAPASPKTSPFPTLPDMSPKKVSAAHNVYVSPLRSSKI